MNDWKIIDVCENNYLLYFLDNYIFHIHFIDIYKFEKYIGEFHDYSMYSPLIHYLENFRSDISYDKIYFHIFYDNVDCCIEIYTNTDKISFFLKKDNYAMDSMTRAIFYQSEKKINQQIETLTKRINELEKIKLPEIPSFPVKIYIGKNDEYVDSTVETVELDKSNQVYFYLANFRYLSKLKNITIDSYSIYMNQSNDDIYTYLEKCKELQSITFLINRIVVFFYDHFFEHFRNQIKNITFHFTTRIWEDFFKKVWNHERHKNWDKIFVPGFTEIRFIFSCKNKNPEIYADFQKYCERNQISMTVE